MTFTNFSNEKLAQYLNEAGNRCLFPDYQSSESCFSDEQLLEIARKPLEQLSLDDRKHCIECLSCARTYSLLHSAYLISDLPDHWQTVLSCQQDECQLEDNRIQILGRISFENLQFSPSTDRSEWIAHSSYLRVNIVLDFDLFLISVSILDVPSEVEDVKIQGPLGWLQLCRNDEEASFDCDEFYDKETLSNSPFCSTETFLTYLAEGMMKINFESSHSRHIHPGKETSRTGDISDFSCKNNACDTDITSQDAPHDLSEKEYIKLLKQFNHFLFCIPDDYQGLGINTADKSEESLDESHPHDDIDFHRSFMKRAIVEARKSANDDNQVHAVGVIVVKDGKELSLPYWSYLIQRTHALFPVLCKNNVVAVIFGTTVYSTLGPCIGRNPSKVPIIDWLTEMSIKLVANGMLNPNPSITGLGKSENESLHRAFIRQHNRSSNKLTKQTEEKVVVPEIFKNEEYPEWQNNYEAKPYYFLSYDICRKLHLIIMAIHDNTVECLKNILQSLFAREESIIWPTFTEKMHSENEMNSKWKENNRDYEQWSRIILRNLRHRAINAGVSDLEFNILNNTRELLLEIVKKWLAVEIRHPKEEIMKGRSLSP